MSNCLKRDSGTFCSAYGCNMRTGTNLLSQVKMYKFPKDPKRRQSWEAAVQRKNWQVKPTSVLCNKHFITGKPSTDPTHPDYVPSIFIYEDKLNQETSMSRYQRQLKRRRLQSISQNELCEDVQEELPGCSSERGFTPKTSQDVGCQTDLSFSDIEKSEEQLQASHFKLLEFHEKCGIKSVLQINKQLQFYTKLPNVAFFFALLELLLDNWKPVVKSSVDYSEQLLLVLMKLRLGLLNQDLAFRFQITQSMVSTIFREWIRRMAIVLEKCFKAPSKTNLRRKMPTQFKNENFTDVTALIDCSEIFTERPFNLDARASTFSHYKHHNTVKFLIACTPSGHITFISKLFGGRTSDKQITKLSGFLDTVQPGDIIFADRGFQIEESISERNASVVTPASTKGKKQLSSKEIIQSRKMSRVRIHIERCIGRIKSYRILKTVWPVKLLCTKTSDTTCTGDDILSVIAALCNVTRSSLLKQK